MLKIWILPFYEQHIRYYGSVPNCLNLIIGLKISRVVLSFKVLPSHTSILLESNETKIFSLASAAQKIYWKLSSSSPTIYFWNITERSTELRAVTLLNLSSMMMTPPHLAIVTHLNIVISYFFNSVACLI